MRIAWEGRELYCHISTKAGFDPVKTLYVCAPGADAASYEAAARFAQASGWRDIAEQVGAVLVLPIVPHGWRTRPARFCWPCRTLRKTSGFWNATAVYSPG